MSSLRSRHQSSHSARTWGLIWLGLIALGIWLPLMLVDVLTPGEPLRQPATVGGGAAASDPRQGQLPLAALPAAGAGRGGLDAAIPSGFTAARPAAASWAETRGPQPASSSSSLSHTTRFERSDAPMANARLGPPALSGSLLLGGPLGLESLQEKTMVPAARIEQARRAASGDPLQDFPRSWRSAFKALLQNRSGVLPAEVVRLPAPHLQNPEVIPLALADRGPAETTVQPSSLRSLETLERWAKRRQSSVPPGQVKPVMVVLEPIAADAPPAHLPPQDLNRPDQGLTHSELGPPTPERVPTQAPVDPP